MSAVTESNFSRWFKQTLTRISPELNTRIVFLMKFKKPINLRHPKTLDEKIQWLKLNTYKGNSLVTQCADKYAVRDYVEKAGCGEILNELYGVYDRVEDIPWESLPNQFVLKWNFGSGENLIVSDKSKLNIEDAKKQLTEWYRTKDSFYLTYSEIQYRSIPPKLVCERLIESKDGGLPSDYKLYCFNGHPTCVLVCSGRDFAGQGAKYYFFNRDWKLLRYNKAGKEAPDDFTLPKPEGINLLFDYASVLSRPFPFVRADFYLENGHVTFGELTFTPCGGFDVNRLKETQMLFGSMVKLDMEETK